MAEFKRIAEQEDIIASQDESLVICASAGSGKTRVMVEKITSLVIKEKKSLSTLRNMLTGEQTLDSGQLEALVENCDYLWAHFPDCAGMDGRHPPLEDNSFIRRIRMEIDPFINQFDLALKELSGI